MTAFVPPPLDPRTFFEEYLPRVHAEAVELVGPSPVPLSAHVVLDGEDGGTWEVRIDGAEIEVIPDGPGDDVDVRFALSVDDWRALHGGKLGGPTRMIEEGRPPPKLTRPDPKIVDTVRKLRGTVRFLITGYRGGEWEAWAHLGPGSIEATPKTTFRIGAMDLEELNEGDMDPQRLLMGGVLKVDGDFALAGQLAALAARQLQAIGLGAGAQRSAKPRK